jgi:hypothetical protein
MRLVEYLNTLSWTKADLARESKVSSSTVTRVFRKEAISRQKAKQICEALTKALKRRIMVSDIDELRISDIREGRPGRRSGETET